MAPRRAASLALALPFALSACSGGPPSESEARAALARQYESVLGQPGVVRRIDSFSLAGCHEDPIHEGYRCDVSGQVVLAMLRHEQRLPLAGPVRFSHASGEWTAHRVND